MPKEAEKVTAEFHNTGYGPPCSDDDIRRATVALGEPLPAVLEEFYRAFNGFRGPTNAGFFWQLFASPKNPTGLVEMNKFLRENADDPFPRKLSRCACSSETTELVVNGHSRRICQGRSSNGIRDGAPRSKLLVTAH